MKAIGRRPRRRRWLGLEAFPKGGGAVAAAVFNTSTLGRRTDLWSSAVVSGAVLVGIGAWVMTIPPRLRAKEAAPPDMVVELFEAPPPPVAAPAPPPPPTPPPVRKEIRLPPSVPAAPAPAPVAAQAAAVVAQEAPAEEILDLSSFTVAAGDAPAFAGGSTASGGTNTQPVTGPVSPTGPATGTGTAIAALPNLSRPVRLMKDEWDCPWPAEADTLGIDEQAVVLSVVVRVDGSVETAEAVKDPGHGFGAAAMVCARGARFEPARDRGGAPIQARSGPIRVLFIR